MPVRNEAALLPMFLHALAAQRDAPNFVLCVLLDNCADGSAELVETWRSSSSCAVVTAHAEPGPPNAGLARRRAMDMGMSLLRGSEGMIVSTDADSVPAPNWLCANAEALEIADVAAGRIARTGGQACPVQDRLETYFDALFALRRAIDPVPWEAPRPHHYASAASLAFRGHAYELLDGFEPLISGEDGRLVDRAHRAGMRVRRDATIEVKTSARRDGRAAGGLADHLRRLDAGDAQPVMAHPEDAVWRYERQAAARVAWTQAAGDWVPLAMMLQCDAAHIGRVAAEAINAEAFAMSVVPDVPGGERLVLIDEAETALRQLCGVRPALAA